MGFSGLAKMPVADAKAEEGSAAELGVADASMMIAGNMVGAGMLALPVTSQTVGFGPTAVSLVVIWLLSAVSANVIGALSKDLSAETGRRINSYGSLAKAGMGTRGGALVSILNIVLNYLLLVAYVGQGAVLLHQLMDTMNAGPAASMLTRALGDCHVEGAFYSTLFGGLAASATRMSDETFQAMNRVLIGAILLSFATLVSSTLPRVDPYLLSLDWHFELLPSTIGVFICSMVFHNCVPMLSSRLGPRPAGPVPAGIGGGEVLCASLLGSGVPLLMYLLYDATVMGVSPDVSIAAAAVDVGSGVASDLAPSVLGPLWTFSISAVVTSFWSTFTAQLEELKSLASTGDEAKASNWQQSDTLLSLACLAPPVVLTTLYPDSAIAALNAGGLGCDLLLYGAIPAILYKTLYSGR